jgi:hypothetical protein
MAAPSKFPSVIGRLMLGMCSAFMIFGRWEGLRYAGTHAKGPGEPPEGV